MLSGPNVQLVPMVLTERKLFFRWATQSHATPWWYGERYGDTIPNYEAFKLDWHDDYFQDTSPEKGRCYKIMKEGLAIGQINYNQIHSRDQSTELDILLADRQHQGQGYGAEAIQILCTYLFSSRGVRRIRIEVIRDNLRAIAAYRKAGFTVIYGYEINQIPWQVMERLAPNPLEPAA